jgi:hypothetical protein
MGKELKMTDQNSSVVKETTVKKKGFFLRKSTLICLAIGIVLWNFWIDPKVPKKHKMTHELQVYINSPPPRPNYQDHLRDIVLEHHPLGSNVNDVENAFEQEGWKCYPGGQSLTCVMIPFPARFSLNGILINVSFVVSHGKTLKANVQQNPTVTMP